MASYYPNFDGFSEEDIALISKHMPFDQYEQNIKDHAGPHGQVYKTAHDKLPANMQLLPDSIELHGCVLVTTYVTQDRRGHPDYRAVQLRHTSHQ